jgi:hypothetical protein
VEIYWKAGTGDNGITRIWIDGSLGFEETDNDTDTRAADSVRLGNISGIMADGDYYYLDDLIGSTTAIGAYAESGGSALPIILQQMM